MKTLIFIALLCLQTSLLLAQSPVNGFMQGKGKGNVVVSYYTETYNRTYQNLDGTVVTSPVKTNSVNAFSTFGVSKKVDLQFTLTYQKASSTLTPEIMDIGKKANFQSGLQDFSAYIKYNPYIFKLKKSTLSILGATGIVAPFGNYKINSPLQSTVVIGSRSLQFTNVILTHFKINSGLFFTGSFGYSLKTNHIPNAAIAEMKVGLALNKIYFDAFVSTQDGNNKNTNQSQNTNASFAVSNADYSKIGFNIFVPIVKKIGLAGGLIKYTKGASKHLQGGFGAIIYSF